MRRASIAFVVLAAVCAGGVGSARAETHWQASHPRRAEVNHRLENQNMRIHEARHDGRISGHEARELHREDRHVRREERLMASEHDSHITRMQQNTLNRQENAISHRISQ
jgi:hypothetical protein